MAGCLALEPPPGDTVQQVAFGPSAIAAASWDGFVRCWEIQGPNARPVAEQQLPAPALDLAWQPGGMQLLLAGSDGSVSMWDVGANQVVPVGKHDNAVRTCHFSQATNCLVTTSWDKTLRAWDLRQPNAVATAALPERSFAADVRDKVVVVATAERHLVAYEMAGAFREVVQLDSSLALKMQLRCVSIFPDQTGVAVGSVEGRFNAVYFDAARAKQNFNMKCHRGPDGKGSPTMVHSAHFTPHGPLMTTGGDGFVSFWDCASHKNLSSFPEPSQRNMPVTCSSINADGTLIAFAAGYDWSQEAAHHNPAVNPSQIYVRELTPADLTPAPRR